MGTEKGRRRACGEGRENKKWSGGEELWRQKTGGGVKVRKEKGVALDRGQRMGC